MNGVTSNDPLEYEYILAGKPVTDIRSSLCGAPPVKVSVSFTACDDNGSIDPVSIKLSATYDAFSIGTAKTARYSLAQLLT